MATADHRPPVVVVDRGAGDDVDLEAIAIPKGWTRRKGFDLPDGPWDLSGNKWICTGHISDEAQATIAMAALVRGVGLVVRLTGPGAFRLQVLDDLHHNGKVLSGNESRGPVADLLPDDVALLRALAEGCTVEAAARRVIMSPRTAARRLAVIREMYGATNTTEAVSCWLADRSPPAERG